MDLSEAKQHSYRKGLVILREEFSRNIARLRFSFATKMSAKGILVLALGLAVLLPALANHTWIPKIPALVLILIAWFVPHLMVRAGIPGGLSERLFEASQRCYQLLNRAPPHGQSFAAAATELLRRQAPDLAVPQRSAALNPALLAASLRRLSRDFERASAVELLDRRPARLAWWLMLASAVILGFWALVHTRTLPLFEPSERLGAIFGGFAVAVFGAGYAQFMYWHGLLRTALDLALRDLLEDELELLGEAPPEPGDPADGEFELDEAEY